MKFSFGFLPLLLALCENNVSAFAPVGISGRQSTARSLIDPSNLQEVPHHIQSLQDVMSTFSIADLDSAGLPISDVAASAAPVAAAAAEEVAKTDNGWFGFLTGPIMAFLQLIHTGIVAAGVDSNSWGVAIITLTLTIKLLTYPITKQQLESTQKMQALQPALKEVQAKYQSNPEVMNQKIAELYQTNNVNPLAGCIPSLVQLPVFIGLYRAVLDLANENVLDEPFLFLPSLEGPTYGADAAKGASWLFDWVNGAPSLGWEDTGAFLVLPVLLVLTQFASMEFMTPKEQKDQQPAFLKVLPLMIGYFSLNVPSALCVYWITNNIVTSASSVIIRNSLQMEPAVVGGGSIDVQSESIPETVTAFSPPTIREKPDGFASASSSGVTPITSTSSDIVDVDVETESIESGSPIPSAPTSSKKKRGKKRKKKRN